MRNVPTTTTDAASQRSIRTKRSSTAVTAATLARCRLERGLPPSSRATGRADIRVCERRLVEIDRPWATPAIDGAWAFPREAGQAHIADPWIAPGGELASIPLDEGTSAGCRTPARGLGAQRALGDRRRNRAVRRTASSALSVVLQPRVVHARTREHWSASSISNANPTWRVPKGIGTMRATRAGIQSGCDALCQSPDVPARVQRDDPRPAWIRAT